MTEGPTPPETMSIFTGTSVACLTRALDANVTWRYLYPIQWKPSSVDPTHKLEEIPSVIQSILQYRTTQAQMARLELV